MNKEIIVSISCITYNQAAYIRECIDGFLMQKTSFPFEILIHDDCSTDGTTEIIQEYAEKYPDIIKPLYETENQYQNGKPAGSAVWNFPRAKGKYIAICEGDDYWIDPLKLQKQVDFLEANQEYGMCYGKVERYNEKKRCVTGISGNNRCSFKDIIKANQIPTLTALFKKEFFNSYVEKILPDANNWKMGDKPLWLWISLNSKIFFMNEVLGVYRILPDSASHTRDFKKWLDFIISACDISFYFLKLANRNDSLLKSKYYAFQIMNCICTKNYSHINEFRKKLKNNYKLKFNFDGFLQLGLIMCPRLFYYIGKNVYLHRNK